VVRSPSPTENAPPFAENRPIQVTPRAQPEADADRHSQPGVRLDNCFSPSDLEDAIADFVEYCKHARYHEALDNLMPADVCFGLAKEVMDRREEIKRRTLETRRARHIRQEGV